MTTVVDENAVDQNIPDARQLLNELADASDGSETPRKMKLAYLTTEYPKASHTFVRRELRALESRGHDIVRVSVRGCAAVVDPADLEEAEKTHLLLGGSLVALCVSFLKVLLLSPWNFARAIRTAIAMWTSSNRGAIKHFAYLVEATRLVEICRQYDVEHVHVHFGKNAADVALLAKRMGGPTFSMTIHGPGEFDAPVGYGLGRKVEESTFTAAISHYGTAQIRRWVSYQHWDKLKVVRCTINEDFLSQCRPLTEDTNQFVCVGRLTGQKGQLLLVDAVGLLKRQGVEVNLVLAGDGEMRNVIESRVAELGVNENVSITGWIGEAEVRHYLQTSRAMVLPSFAEGLPVAIMESLALGRPVISTCITGIPELLRDKENGWMITAGCVEDIARAMKQAMETSLEEINHMGQNGNQRVARQHLASTEAARLESYLLAYCESND